MVDSERGVHILDETGFLKREGKGGPTCWYGPSIDGSGWSDRGFADRSVPGLRVQPGG